MHIIFFILIIVSSIFGSVRKDNHSFEGNTKYPAGELGRIGKYGYPNNPQLDRAKGYLLKGKIQSAVVNYGNFITWDYHPAGLWNNFARTLFLMIIKLAIFLYHCF